MPAGPLQDLVVMRPASRRRSRYNSDRKDSVEVLPRGKRASSISPGLTRRAMELLVVPKSRPIRMRRELFRLWLLGRRRAGAERHPLSGIHGNTVHIERPVDVWPGGTP